MEVIQKLMVVCSPPRFYEVGTELNGRDVIEIKNMSDEYEDHIHSEYWVLDENGELIASIENCPVIVEWQTIAEHDEIENDPRQRVISGT
ncbi:hypothetical protein [Paenibacillus sp. VMFN-D1]|uniref:hypothetical protein n=1 Tax=Paenibacillus sp. VMFN-D1 TaxID=2135608 RepID=UPI000E24DEF2|nr:hypothetical protein [Paenibacillus sp. VMFN-D1]RED34703.1 hypothetical protein C7820_4366 [Paenibacillus sp. VMFN-D1]